MNDEPDIELHNKMAGLTRFVYVISYCYYFPVSTFMFSYKTPENLGVTVSLDDPGLENKVNLMLSTV